MTDDDLEQLADDWPRMRKEIADLKKQNKELEDELKELRSERKEDMVNAVILMRTLYQYFQTDKGKPQEGKVQADIIKHLNGLHTRFDIPTP